MNIHHTGAVTISSQGMRTNWWRFNSYEVKEGYIRPAPGAKLEAYDPWEVYENSQKKTDSPYVSLLNLIVRLNIPPDNQKAYTLTPKSRELLLTWCAEHGLLGILPQQVHKVTFAARGKHIGYRVDAEQISYTRIQNYWSLDRSLGNDHRHHESEEDWPADREAEEREVEEVLLNGFGPPSVTLLPLWENEIIVEPLSKTWEKFFPGISDEERARYQYPKPLSEEFWHIYAEPVDSFLNAAGTLKKCLEFLTKNDRLDYLGDVDLDILIGLIWISSLTSSAGLGLYLSENKYLTQLSSPSLLGLYALMAALDLSQNEGPYRCEACGRFFGRGAHKAVYCSPKCRRTAQQRKRRNRIKEKEQ